MQHCAKVAGHHKLYCWKRLARRAVMTASLWASHRSRCTIHSGSAAKFLVKTVSIK